MCKKRQSSQQCRLAVLWPTSVKAVRRTLMKLTPGVNQCVDINNSFWAAFRTSVFWHRIFKAKGDMNKNCYKIDGEIDPSSPKCLLFLLSWTDLALLLEVLSALLLRLGLELGDVAVVASLHVLVDATENGIPNDCVICVSPVDAFTCSVGTQLCVRKIDIRQFVIVVVVPGLL